MIVQRLERPLNGVIADSETIAAHFLKEHVRVLDDDFDRELLAMAATAVAEAEDFAQLALRSQAVRVTLTEWPLGPVLALPIGPMLAADSVTVTVNGAAFYGFTALTGPRPALALTAPRPCGPVMVEYIAGYGETAAAIPEDLRHAVMDQAAAYFDARGAVDAKRVSLSPHFARILGRYRGVRA